MIIHIKNHSSHAGKWIYRGFFNAWKSLGYDVKFYHSLDEIDTSTPFQIMTYDSEVKSDNLHVIEKSYRSYIFAQPNKFPMPWGSHPNFICMCDDSTIEKLNSLPNVILWTWMDSQEYHTKWNNVNTVPLAFDNIAYRDLKKDEYVYDVCYVGGWANNGFDEKRANLINCFKSFRDSGLKCGFFINKNLTHEQENFILCNSKVSLNIHDNYQRVLGLDTNERTFKSLGTTGALVTDKINQISRLFPEVLMSENSNKLVEHVKSLIDSSELEEIKIKNIELINLEHTYINRINRFLKI